MALKKYERDVYRVKRRLKWDEDGVASTVGTIMALMVFLAFMNMITTSYVPVWMKENEANHMVEAQAQFGTLKQNIDLQILMSQLQGHTDVIMYSPITLGAKGVPLFAAETPGQLDVLPGEGTVETSFQYLIDTEVTTVREYSNGQIRLDVPNRYYIAQELIYENGAIILSQDTGDVVRASPHLKAIVDSGGNVEITYTQISLMGENNTLSGMGTEGIHTELVYTDSQEYTGIAGSETIYLNTTTTHYEIWESFYRNFLTASGLTEGTNFAINLLGSGDTQTVSVQIWNVEKFNHHHTYIEIDMGDKV